MGDLPTVFILAGGLGTRLRSVVKDRPKALANAGDAPFLDLQLKWLAKQGVRNVILLTGYMADKIKIIIKFNSTKTTGIFLTDRNYLCQMITFIIFIKFP